jgi:hypothetical protein
MAEKKETPGEKEAREAQEALDAEDMGTGGKAENGEPVSLDDRRKGRTGSQLATDGKEDEPEPEADGQMAWDVEPGKRMTLGSLIPCNTPVEYKVKIAGKSVNLKGGLNDPQSEQVAVSALVVSKFEVVYIRDGNAQITKVIVYEHKEAKSVNPAKSEAAQLMLNGVTAEAS